MKITCPKDKLQHAVQIVQKAVSAKATLPILSGIFLSAENNKLQLQATDYEIGISCTLEAQVDIPGKIVVSGRYFQELVKRLPGDSVEIAAADEDHTIKITAGTSQFNLLSLPAVEFPVLKSVFEKTTGTHAFTIKDNILRELIKKTTFACSTEESRPIFTGALLELTTEDVRMVATNTHRLAFKKSTLDHITSDSLKIIIPSKILNELSRLLSSELPVDVSVCWEKSRVAFSFENVYLESRLIEGQYPDYNRVIPPKFDTVATIDTALFMDAVERVSLMAKDGEYNVIKFQFTDNEVIITSNNPDIGKAYETIPCHMNGTEIMIAFNAKYVTDILKNIGSTELYFSLNTPLSPASITPNNDVTYTYIITPVRTS